jgi:hypothetical protein
MDGVADPADALSNEAEELISRWWGLGASRRPA